MNFGHVVIFGQVGSFSLIFFLIGEFWWMNEFMKFIVLNVPDRLGTKHLDVIMPVV